jgi:hypothetical protein
MGRRAVSTGTSERLIRRSAAGFVALAVVIAATMLVSACSSTKAATPDCRPAHAPQFPTTDAALDDADAGQTWCANVGETITVSLHVPPADAATAWRPIATSNSTVLQPISNGVASLARGVTATFFEVRAPGVATVTSTRSDGAAWNAQIVAKPK